MKERKRYTDILQTAEFMQISVNSIRKLVKRRQLPHMKINGKYFFDLDLVEEYIKQQMVLSTNKSEEMYYDL
jgi:hypothetical protein